MSPTLQSGHSDLSFLVVKLNHGEEGALERFQRVAETGWRHQNSDAMKFYRAEFSFYILIISLYSVCLSICLSDLNSSKTTNHIVPMTNFILKLI